MAKGPYYQEGAYEGEVIRQALGVSGQNSTPAFILSVRIVGKLGADGVSYQVDAEFERTIYLYLTEKTKDFTLEKLKVLGFNKTSLKYLSPEVNGFVDFVGKTIPLWCSHETYEGNTREKWNVSTPREAKPVAPIESRDLTKLDALFGKGLKEIAAAAAPAPEKQETVSAGATKTDDVPF